MRQTRVALTVLALLHVGVNSLPAQSEQPVARIGARVVPAAELDAQVASQIRPLEEQMYAIRRRALEQLIVEEILRTEAQRRGMTADELRREIQSKARVTEAEIDKYLSQAPTPASGVDADIVRETTRMQLLTRARVAALQQAVRELRTAAQVEILLPALPPERADVRTDGYQTLGDSNAAVTIVEFADFQCPFCASMNPTLHELVRSSKGRVKLVHRDFPLPNHPLAWRAAEAARCAGDQHKFWEYQTRLFDRASSLTEQMFEVIASEVALDSTEFKKCIADGKYTAAVRSDVDEGRRIGVRATPTFVINGTIFRGAPTKADLEKIIAAELDRVARAEQRSGR